MRNCQRRIQQLEFCYIFRKYDNRKIRKHATVTQSSPCLIRGGCRIRLKEAMERIRKWKMGVLNMLNISQRDGAAEPLAEMI